MSRDDYSFETIKEEWQDFCQQPWQYLYYLLADPVIHWLKRRSQQERVSWLFAALFGTSVIIYGMFWHVDDSQPDTHAAPHADEPFSEMVTAINGHPLVRQAELCPHMDLLLTGKNPIATTERLNDIASAIGWPVQNKTLPTISAVEHLDVLYSDRVRGCLVQEIAYHEDRRFLVALLKQDLATLRQDPGHQTHGPAVDWREELHTVGNDVLVDWYARHLEDLITDVEEIPCPYADCH